MPITHKFVSGKSDGSDATQVQPSNWNDTHTIAIFVDAETPTGSINSTDGSDGNGTFTLANAPAAGTTVKLYKNGLLQKQNVQYTISGSTIQYVIPYYPKTGDWHEVHYRIP